ncbi:MAG TPA: metallophosphoesterase family protein [Candidatus Aquilonibacter sp.]|nr:metallophosphoesterase family protein [Candidatus Aquilonibacter sp.]
MIGVLSDTHSLLRPEALDALRGATHILHAGDVGDIAILEALRKIAPVTAIRGNIDTGGPTAQLPATEAIELNGRLIYMLHSLADLDLKPEAAGISVVISGHSHKPTIETRNGVLYLNPGSCGPRRFSLPVTVAHLRVGDAVPRAEIVRLSV